MNYPIDVLPQAIVFDMDGTLVDSERLQLQCFMETTGKYGFDAREELYLQCIGATGAVARTILCLLYTSPSPRDS